MDLKEKVCLVEQSIYENLSEIVINDLNSAKLDSFRDIFDIYFDSDIRVDNNILYHSLFAKMAEINPGLIGKKPLCVYESLSANELESLMNEIESVAETFISQDKGQFDSFLTEASTTDSSAWEAFKERFTSFITKAYVISSKAHLIFNNVILDKRYSKIMSKVEEELHRMAITIFESSLDDLDKSIKFLDKYKDNRAFLEDKFNLYQISESYERIYLSIKDIVIITMICKLIYHDLNSVYKMYALQDEEDTNRETNDNVIKNLIYYFCHLNKKNPMNTAEKLYNLFQFVSPDVVSILNKILNKNINGSNTTISTQATDSIKPMFLSYNTTTGIGLSLDSRSLIDPLASSKTKTIELKYLHHMDALNKYYEYFFRDVESLFDTFLKDTLSYSRADIENISERISKIQYAIANFQGSLIAQLNLSSAKAVHNRYTKSQSGTENY